MSQFSLTELLYLMERLRDPVDGCPWDIKQSWSSIAPSTLEEAYEVADAIERRDFAALGEELGDLLFQVIFYAQLGKESGHFDFAQIVDQLVAKLLRRHPHVFPEGRLDSRRSAGQLGESQIKESWESIKQNERQAKGQLDLFADVPLNLPGLSRAQKLQKRAARVGFDWPHISGVVEKIDEELAELKVEIRTGSQESIEHELGDMLFSLVNLCRHLKVDAEAALRRCNLRFEKRFEIMAELLQNSGSNLEESSAEELEACWERAKLHIARSGG